MGSKRSTWPDASTGRRADGPVHAGARRCRGDRRGLCRATGYPGYRARRPSPTVNGSPTPLPPAPPATCSRTARPRNCSPPSERRPAGHAPLDPRVAGALLPGGTPAPAQDSASARRDKCCAWPRSAWPTSRSPAPWGSPRAPSRHTSAAFTVTWVSPIARRRRCGSATTCLPTGRSPQDGRGRTGSVPFLGCSPDESAGAFLLTFSPVSRTGGFAMPNKAVISLATGMEDPARFILPWATQTRFKNCRG